MKWDFQAIEEAMNRTDRSFAQSSGPLETDPDYKLIVASNKLIQDIEEEIIKCVLPVDLEMQ